MIMVRMVLMVVVVVVMMGLAVDHVHGKVVGANGRPFKKGRTTWTLPMARQSVTVGANDKVVFAWKGAVHDVLEVSKADFDACNDRNPVSTVAPVGGSGRAVVAGFAKGATRYCSLLRCRRW